MFSSASLCAGLCANMRMCSSMHTVMSNSHELQYLRACPGMKGYKEVWGHMAVSGRGVETNVEVCIDEWGVGVREGVEVSRGVEVSVKMGVEASEECDGPCG